MLEPALERAKPVPWAKYKVANKRLAQSLICYVSEEDMVLSRKVFLKTVISRIEDDLQHGTE